MATTPSCLPVSVPAGTLLTDYGRWLNFVTAARHTVRRYDRRLVQIARQHPDLGELSGYLRGCMHQRSQLFGSLTLQLTGCVAQLRAEPTNEALIRRLTLARPVMQALITKLEAAFTELNAAYRQLLSGESINRPGLLKPRFTGITVKGNVYRYTTTQYRIGPIQTAPAEAVETHPVSA